MRMEFDEEKVATLRRKENKKADVPVQSFDYPKIRNLKVQGRATRDEGANRKIVTGKNV